MNLIQIQTSNREGEVTLRRIAIRISSKVSDGVPSYNEWMNLFIQKDLDCQINTV